MAFTLIETMVAGLIMSLTLVAVARLSISAISTSSHQTIRRKIEAAVNNDMSSSSNKPTHVSSLSILQTKKLRAKILDYF